MVCTHSGSLRSRVASMQGKALMLSEAHTDHDSHKFDLFTVRLENAGA